MQWVHTIHAAPEAASRDWRVWLRRHRGIVVALTLSLLFHALLLVVRRVDEGQGASRPTSLGETSLSVRLAPPPAPAAEPAPPASVTAAASTPRPAPPAKPRRPRVMTVPAPAPALPTAPPAQAEPAADEVPQPVAPPPPAPPAPPMDMLAQLNAIRQRRGQASDTPHEPDPPSEAERAARNAMRNLRSLTPGQDRDGTNGVFALTQLSYSRAEFTFRGWNTNFRRDWNETVTVERGAHGDIRLAVVRKMIEIIRRYETGDFVWESRRLGRSVSLSARPGDTAGLEDFLMREFFPEFFRPGG